MNKISEIYEEVKKVDRLVKSYEFLIKYRKGYLWGLNEDEDLVYVGNSEELVKSKTISELKDILCGKYEEKENEDINGPWYIDVVSVDNYENIVNDYIECGFRNDIKKDVNRFKELLENGASWEKYEFDEVGIFGPETGMEFILFKNEEGFVKTFEA